ncbi:MAG TPA: L,D-transpeptidase [Solirubrobacteraceae bacterium]
MAPATTPLCRTLLAVGLAIALVLTAVATAPAAGRVAPAIQELATLSHDTGAFQAPDPSSGRVTELSDVRPITAERTVLPIIGHAAGPRGLRWVEVLLPGRPNGHTGWIRRRATTESITRWRLTISLSMRTVTVFYAGRAVRTLLAVVGKPSTPTPTGRFFVEETVAMGPQQSGAPYALALSARSDALREFDGGPGQIALHGVENIGGIPGTAASHGCIRLATPGITWLAARVPPGVPVMIVR